MTLPSSSDVAVEMYRLNFSLPSSEWPKELDKNRICWLQNRFSRSNGPAPKEDPHLYLGQCRTGAPKWLQGRLPGRARLSPSQTLKTHTDNWGCRTKAFLLGTRLESCQTPVYLRLNVDKAGALLRFVTHAVWKTNTSLPSALRPAWQMTPNSYTHSVLPELNSLRVCTAPRLQDSRL